jgi:hypothetical protein
MDEIATRSTAETRIIALPQIVLQGLNDLFDLNEIILPAATKGETTTSHSVGWAKRSVPTIQSNGHEKWWGRRKCAFAHPTAVCPTPPRFAVAQAAG